MLLKKWDQLVVVFFVSSSPNRANADTKKALDKANIGRALIKVRAARGVTQEDLLFAVSRRHVGRIEQGHQVPSIHVIENLAESLQIHPMTLIAMAYSQDADVQSIDQVLQAVKADLLELYPQDEAL